MAYIVVYELLKLMCVILHIHAICCLCVVHQLLYPCKILRGVYFVDASFLQFFQ